MIIIIFILINVSIYVLSLNFILFFGYQKKKKETNDHARRLLNWQAGRLQLAKSDVSLSLSHAIHKP